MDAEKEEQILQVISTKNPEFDWHEADIRSYYCDIFLSGLAFIKYHVTTIREWVLMDIDGTFIITVYPTPGIPLS